MLEIPVGELVGTGLQRLQAGMAEVAAEGHGPGVQRHRLGERPDDHAGCQRPLQKGQDRQPFGTEVPHRLLHPLGVRVRRARLSIERRQQAHPEVDPFRRVLVAGADVHPGAAKGRQRHHVHGGQRVLLWEQQRQRLEADQPAGELLGQIPVPEVAANLAWGDGDAQTLYVTASTGLYRVRCKATGHVPHAPARRA
jgi:hypothetical protein